MTVTLYSLIPPTTSTSSYLLRATPLNGPRTTPLPRSRQDVLENAGLFFDILQDIDDWYSQTIEDDGFLERLDRSAESVRFP